MRVAIYGRSFDDSFTSYIQDLFNTLHTFGWKYKINESFYNFLKPRLILNNDVTFYKNHLDLVNETDIIISIGGDGTILDSIHLVKDSEIPILGVNTGRLGFLSSTQKEEIVNVLHSIKEGKYRLQPRTLLELDSDIKYFGNDNFALNELTVHKKDTSSMITIHAYIDDLYLNSYWADGLIISTPTGSTAYSLSCGGPILVPGANCFVITPIAPHNLNVRPVVVPDTRTVRLRIESRSKDFLCSMDSRSVAIQNETELVVKKSNFPINIIQTEGQNFLNTIRNKMMWGLDRRN